MMSCIVTKRDTYKHIGKVFVQNGINYIFSESGLGKTLNTLLLLNNDDIEPILIDFDENQPFDKDYGLKVTMVDGPTVAKKYIEGKLTIPKNQVIILDTWQMMLNYDLTIDFANTLKSNNNTVIIIGHTKGIATKQDLPDMPNEIANHMHSKLYLFKRKRDVYLEVKKCRGYNKERELHLYNIDKSFKKEK